MKIGWGSQREQMPWITRDVLWGAQAVVLSVVSAYYTFRFAKAHEFPWWLAWSLFMALELSAAIGMVVRSRPRDRTAKYHAVALVAGSITLAAIVNGLMHAMDRDLIEVTTAGVLLTGAVVPAMLAWSSHVARGMAPRPKDDQVEESVVPPEVVDVVPEQMVTLPVDPIPIVGNVIKPEITLSGTIDVVEEQPTDGMSPREYVLNAWRFGRRVETQDLYERFPDRKKDSLRSVLSTVRKTNAGLEPPVRNGEEDRNGNRQRKQRSTGN